MSLTSEEILQNFNERILSQNILIQTLCDVIVGAGIISEGDLEGLIEDNFKITEEELDRLRDEYFDEEPQKINGLHYYGPKGEA